MEFLQKYKFIAYVSFNLQIQYIAACTYSDVYCIKFRVKPLYAPIYDYVELQIPLGHDFDDSAHKVFFNFFEQYITR